MALTTIVLATTQKKETLPPHHKNIEDNFRGVIFMKGAPARRVFLLRQAVKIVVEYTFWPWRRYFLLLHLVGGGISDN